MKIALILLLVILPTVCAAETRLLTLDQAIAIAMDKNRDIEKAREYAQYVQGKYVEERAAALPQLQLNGTVLLSKDETQITSGAAAQQQFGRTVDLTVSQPLYTWGKLNAAIRAAEVGLKTADEQLRLYRQAAYRDVVAAYLDVQLARELSRLAVENRSQKQRHLDEATRKFTAGVATDYDVLAAEVAAQNTQPEVIRSENSIRMAREQLRFLLASGVQDVDVVGTLETPAVARPLPASYDEAVKIASERRPELKDLRLRIGIYNELVTIAGTDNKPRLDMKGGVGWHWASADNPGPAWDVNGAAWNVGVYLSFPFFDGFRTSGRVTQARSDLRTKQIEETKLLDSISLEVRQAEFSYLEATEILKALSGTVKQAERLVQMAEKGYEFGVKIRLEVDDAQVNLLQARSNMARAERDIRVALVNYLWSMGVAGE
ncbi:MAG: TolC family protein [Desulfuromonadaceae bacterium]|nr:TolC family protein [Desulfuromonadaceae bacterium]MDD2849380.1 TolC family protein [Desulfuromonadaceae bacterium]MDD4130052.1 TolC family protein [Desulfuromonadaceae bacterium]